MSGTDIDSVKRRIKKLLALSKSPNENEAVLAVKMADDLISRYSLKTSEFSGFEEKSVKTTKCHREWHAIIANAVERLYATYHYKDVNTGEFIFFGSELDVFMSTEMYAYLVKAIDRIARNNIRKNAKYKFRQSYRVGMAERIWDRIDEMGKNCSWRSQEDVFAQRKEFSNYVHRGIELSADVPKKRMKLNQNARMQGSKIADEINLSCQVSGDIIKRICQ
ncbi:MAG: DUF2786 domain-containing protein [Treponema sp.]|nr:DUF2786 domain-containing protein [Treponema sp.]